MKSLLRIIILLSIFVILFTSSLGYTYEFKFQKNRGIKLEVLSEHDFSTKFGNNPEIPRTSEDVIALAKRLYPSLQEKRLEKEKRVEKTEVRACGEHGIGLLFAALQNPAIPDTTRDAVDTIITNSKPQFNKHITSGHFEIYYTDNCENNDCVTDGEAVETADWLNKWWDTYVDDFTPLPELIDIGIYYLGEVGEEIWGRTDSRWDYIELNSKLTVKDPCRIKTVSAHELFHRLQYKYGYESGMVNMDWMSEGTASWSQKYTNSKIGDYIDAMNRGLDTPGSSLITKRRYDACHFWVYLEEKTKTNWEAIKDVWSHYKETGHTAEDARNSVDTVVKKRLGIDFNTFFQEWIKTNYIKDLENAEEYDYDEDKTEINACERKYGPLRSVPKEEVAIKKNTKWSYLAYFDAYATHYYEFKIDRKLKNLNIFIDGKDGSNLSYYFIGIKKKKYQKPITSIQSSGDNEYLFTKKLKPGEWDKVAVIVGSGEIGGYYTISIGNALIYVDAVNGNDTTGTGKKEKPFKTISKGVSVADDGCTIKAAKGTYDNEGTFNNEVLIEDLNINLMGAGTGTSTLALYGGIRIKDSKEVKIMGFTLTTGTDGGSGGINLWNSEASIISNEFNKCGGVCIGLTNNSTATITSNEIHDTLGSGIIIAENSEGKIISNEIYNNSLNGILVDNAKATITSNKIHDNLYGRRCVIVS